MTISEKGLQIIRNFEELVLHPYRDSVGVATIGYGTTHYETGLSVTMGDPKISVDRANELLRYEANAKGYVLSQSLDKNSIKLNQNQFDSLISFAYNVGIGGLLGSTLFRLIKSNTKDPKITDAFMMWVKGTIKGKKVVLQGLVSRRKQEAKLYFS